MGATTRVARLAALGHKRHSKPIYNMMSIKLPRPQYVVSDLIFSPFHPSKLWLNQTPIVPKRTYQRANRIRFEFLTIPPALDSPRSLSQSLRRSDFDIQFSRHSTSPFSRHSTLFQLAKKSSQAAQLPLLERKTSKFASPSPQIHSKTPPSVPKPLPFFSRFHLVKSLPCLFNKRGR